MKTPKIKFDYSGRYNEIWKQWMEIYEKKDYESHKFDENLSSKKILKILEKYKNGFEKLWKNYDKKVFGEVSKLTGLKWQEDCIICYIVKNCITLSDPLTMHAYKNYLDFMDTLIHELIHKIFYEHVNYKKTRGAWNYINRRYRNENQKVISHIPVFAIMQHIYLRFFDMKRLERHINMMKSSPDYARAWQIVQEEGYQNIIREFRKRIK